MINKIIAPSGMLRLGLLLGAAAAGLASGVPEQWIPFIAAGAIAASLPAPGLLRLAKKAKKGKIKAG